MKARFVICGFNECTGGYQYYCFNDVVKLNRHGNITVTVKFHSFQAFRSFQGMGEITYVFDRLGKCISHPASSKYKLHMENAYFSNLDGLMLTSPIQFEKI